MDDEKYDLKWKTYSDHLVGVFKDLGEEGHFADVTLVSDDQIQTPAHKVVLSACSSVLKTLLVNNPHSHPLLYLRGIKQTELQALLKFMYFGETQIFEDHVNNFLAIAKDLKIKEVIEENNDSDNFHSKESEMKFETQAIKEDLNEDETIKILQFVNNTGNNFECRLCGFLSRNVQSTLNHFDRNHEDWKEFIDVKQDEGFSSCGNVHNNPGWKEKLKESFEEEIIMKCSEETQEAWRENKKIDQKSKFTRVREEIINRLIDKLIDIHGLVSRPSKEIMSEIIRDCLAPGYPNMFKESGWIRGLKDVARQTWDRVYRKQESLRAETEAWDNDKEPVKILKGRTPATYGIDNYKFNAKVSDGEKNIINSTEDMNNEEEREEIYNRNRKALCHQIRDLEKKVQLIVKGFFKSPLHLKQQFTYLSGVTDVRLRVARNWNRQINDFESYIRRKDVTKEKVKKIDDLRNAVLTKYQGVQTLLQIWICRFMAEIIDRNGDGKSVFLLKDEDISTTGPFIKAIELPDR